MATRLRFAAAFAASAIATSLLPGAATAGSTPAVPGQVAADNPTYTAVENWQLPGYHAPKGSLEESERDRKLSCLAKKALPDKTRVVKVAAKAEKKKLGRALGYQHLTRVSGKAAAAKILQRYSARFINDCAQTDRVTFGASKVYPKQYGVFPVTAGNEQQVSVTAFVFTNAKLSTVKADGRGTLILYFGLVPSPKAVSVILLAVRYPGTITTAAGKPDPKVTAAFITIARKAALSIR